MFSVGGWVAKISQTYKAVGGKGPQLGWDVIWRAFSGQKYLRSQPDGPTSLFLEQFLFPHVQKPSLGWKANRLQISENPAQMPSQNPSPETALKSLSALCAQPVIRSQSFLRVQGQELLAFLILLVNMVGAGVTGSYVFWVVVLSHGYVEDLIVLSETTVSH